MSSPGSATDPWAVFPNRATPPGSSAYYSVRFEHRPLRETTALLFAWRGVLRDVLTDCSDPGVARLKLQWWREEIARSRDSGASHPLARGLTPLFRQYGLPLDPFTEMADAVETAVRCVAPADLDELARQAGRDQGALFELIGRCHGIGDTERLEQLRRLGSTCTLVYLVRDLGIHRRRHYDPLASLPGADDPAGQLGRVAAHARALAAEAPSRGTLPPSIAARSTILLTLLDELERSGFPVMHQRVGLTPLRKLWIAWRAGRRRGLMPRR